MLTRMHDFARRERELQPQKEPPQHEPETTPPSNPSPRPSLQESSLEKPSVFSRTFTGKHSPGDLDAPLTHLGARSGSRDEAEVICLDCSGLSARALHEVLLKPRLFATPSSDFQTSKKRDLREFWCCNL